MSKTNGREINIPKIEEYSTNYRTFCAIVNGKFYGRPMRVFKRLLLFGVEKGWFKAKDVYKQLIWLGFDKNWIADTTIIAWSFEYFIRDGNWKALERLKELEAGLYGERLRNKTRRNGLLLADNETHRQDVRGAKSRA